MTEERFVIRDGLREEDVPTISSFLREFVLSPDAAFDHSEAGKEYFRRKYDPDRVCDWRDDIVMTAWDGAYLAGFGRARKDGFVTHVFVTEKYRRQGLGARLLEILEESLGAEGLKFIFLDSDSESVGFYERNGWVRREPSALDESGVLLVPMEKRME